MITKIDRELAEQIVNTIKMSVIMTSTLLLHLVSFSPAQTHPVSEPFTRLDNRSLLPVLYWK